MQFLRKLLNDDPHAKEQYNKGRVEIVTNVEETIKKISNVINGNSGDGNRNEGATNASTKTTSSSISTSLGTSLTDDMLLGEEEASFISVPKPLKINPKNSELGLAIDTGGSAEVFFLKIFNKAGQSAIAVFKQFKVHSNSIKEVEIKMIEEEIEILSHLKHDNIVKIFGAIGDPNARDVKGERIGVGIVMEYCENGSLRSLLNKNTNNQQHLLNMDLIIHILCEAAKGVEYLHNHMPRAIIHGDIKSDNILIDKEYNTKLCDFGISKLVQTTTASRTNIGQNLGGTIAYKAPETFNGRIECASDVYSFGCVILEMLTGERPWNELGNNVGMIVTKVLVMKEQHNLLKIRTDTPGKLIDLMKRCLDYDKDKRPTMNEVRIELEQMMNNAVLITLDNTSDECKMVENKFFPGGEDKEGSLNRDNYRIVKIDKIRHLFAERRYDAELSNIKSILNSNNVNEQLLFHGTSQTDPIMILNHPDAFMKDYSSEGFYGRGLYFAELARYSNGYYRVDENGNRLYYRYNIPNTNQYQMLVCSVICGRSKEFGNTVNDLTREFSQKDLGTDYQSTHAGPHCSRCAGPGEDDSCMYVIYKDTQVVPKYMITYEKIPSN